MTRRQQRPKTWRLVLLVALIGTGLYVNQVVVPATPPLFVNTPTPTTSPESYINQAQTLYQQGNLTEAIAAYESAVAADPTNPNIYVELARLQVWKGRYEDAITNTQNALLKNPNHPMAHAVQGWALGNLDRYGEAEVALKKAITLDPNNSLAHAYYAETLIDQNDPSLIEVAADESRQALQLDKTFEAYRARGLVLMNTGAENMQEAVDAFQSAIAINKNFPDVHLYLGIAYKNLGDFDSAEESFLSAYALDPKNAIALTEISRAYFADGRYTQAAQYAEEAVRIEPDNPRMHGDLGINYYKMEDFPKAIPELELAVKGGATDDGIQVEGLTLDYDQRIMSYYWYYGFALAKSNVCSKAIPIFQEMLNTVPLDETAVYNANVGLEICQQNLSGTPTPGPDEEQDSAESVEGGAEEGGAEETGGSGAEE